jgi:aspartokinase-like uncharacterized kinase
MSGLPIRVVKVGGSLFQRRQLPEQLRAWLSAQPPAFHVLIAGGGDLTDVIRSWDSRFELGETNSHWLCVEALSIAAGALVLALGQPSLVRNYQQMLDLLAARELPTAMVFDVQQFLSDIEPGLPPQRLPHRWEVSTDSIAARLAEVLNADELILLKSRPCSDPQPGFVALAAEGFVDDYFPTIAPRVKRVSLVQL